MLWQKTKGKTGKLRCRVFCLEDRKAISQKSSRTVGYQSQNFFEMGQYIGIKSTPYTPQHRKYLICQNTPSLYHVNIPYTSFYFNKNLEYKVYLVLQMFLKRNGAFAMHRSHFGGVKMSANAKEYLISPKILALCSCRHCKRRTNRQNAE